MNLMKPKIFMQQLILKSCNWILIMNLNHHIPSPTFFYRSMILILITRLLRQRLSFTTSSSILILILIHHLSLPTYKQLIVLLSLVHQLLSHTSRNRILIRTLACPMFSLPIIWILVLSLALQLLPLVINNSTLLQSLTRQLFPPTTDSSTLLLGLARQLLSDSSSNFSLLLILVC